MNESWHTWMSHGTHKSVMTRMNESWHTWMSHGTHEWVMARINQSWHTWISHGTHEWVMTRMNKSWHTWISHGTHKSVMTRMNESWHTWMSHGTHEWVMTHTAREASWRRAFDPCAPLLFVLYDYLEQNLHFGLVPEPPKILSARSFLVAGFDTLNSTPLIFQEAFCAVRDESRHTHVEGFARIRKAVVISQQ